MIIDFLGVEYDTDKMNTRKLISFLREIRNSHLSYFCECCGQSLESINPESANPVSEYREALEKVTSELSTREHIPNKPESKQNSINKAKQNKNLNNRKYRNVKVFR